ncbi:alpha/beta fold hydrolase [Neolewinella persica]|uniref:alpha/beta fold hydrolase n=1 Tax=Neolewinella persica TaxID=70998 RepID=UPI0003755E6B|nr:alpha/beta hydrolase [Neolewinella persica]
MLRKKYLIALLLLTPVFLFLVYAFYRFEPFVSNQWNDAKLTAAIASGQFGDATFGYLKGPSRKIRYVQLGEDPSKPMLVFVHGSPSSSAFWFNMLRDSSLRAAANLLAVDRPGYGGSGLGIPMISVKEQASNVAAIIRERRASADQPIILHGSSYGGTVSARIAMDFPDLVKGLLLQSASTAPREEYTYWVTHPTSHWSLSWLLPSSLQTANTEKLSHQQQLEDMANEWSNIKANTVILHGTDDWLIYPPNAYYSCDQLVNAEEVIHHMVPGKEHDLIWSAPKLLKKYLLKLIKREEVATDSVILPALSQG